MKLEVTEAGEGDPLILLHGLFGAGKNLGAIARALAPDFRVISPDLRNHGASPHGADMRYPTMAADVAETMDALGLRQAALVGHSMGGKTAMALALSAPRRVERLAVLDIAPIRYVSDYDDHIEAMRAIPLSADLTRQAADRALAERVPQKMLRAFLLNNLVLGDRPHWRIGLEEIAGAMEDLTDWRDPPRARPYSGEALFLHGGGSDYVPESALPEIEDRFPNARIETIAGAGHWLHAERPDDVAAALRRFLGVTG